jgi:hypothetical protein
MPRLLQGAGAQTYRERTTGCVQDVELRPTVLRGHGTAACSPHGTVGADQTADCKLSKDKDVEMSELNWETAKYHMDSMRQATEELRLAPGCNISFYDMVLLGYEKRYATGERTQELYDEIMEMH